MSNFRHSRRATYQLFLLLLIISSLTAIFALRHNNETMISLRDKVYAADKDGGDVNAALNNLRKYVYGHMNTNLSSGGNAVKPPIQLKYTYERLEAQAQAAANNSGLYTAAENYCQSQIPTGFSGRYRISCVQDYIMSHGGSQAAAIPAGLYEFDFASPSWSPDLAGWSLVVSALTLVGFLITFTASRFNRLIK
ncbi:MAG TPA: hypothetical protein VFT49_03915 [Candidatus Saccharimonadales bacterium]|nr:hypothetical protein [Candidatus Saccharimonadales bacterium]